MCCTLRCQGKWECTVDLMMLTRTQTSDTCQARLSKPNELHLLDYFIRTLGLLSLTSICCEQLLCAVQLPDAHHSAASILCSLCWGWGSVHGHRLHDLPASHHFEPLQVCPVLHTGVASHHVRLCSIARPETASNTYAFQREVTIQRRSVSGTFMTVMAVVHHVLESFCGHDGVILWLVSLYR